jgi:hypothetical protein
MGETRNAYNIFKIWWKETTRKTRRGREDIRMDLKEVGWEGVG